jgi:hypothetical protein
MKMKKVAYLSVLMLSLVLMSTSCCKDEDENPLPNVITVNDLVGNWNFVSLDFNGTVYDTETELFDLDKTYSYIQISLVDVTTNTLGLYDHRGTPTPSTYDDNYTLSNNVINFSGGKFVFEIANWETFNGTVLKLKLKSSSASNQAPINGIYTLQYSN